jgi:hypothetical protein
MYPNCILSCLPTVFLLSPNLLPPTGIFVISTKSSFNMRLSVFLIMAGLLMAASCQKSTTAVVKPADLPLQDRILGTWKYVQYIEVSDYGPFKVTVENVDSLVTDTFTADGKVVLTGYGIEGEGKVIVGTYQVDTTGRYVSNGREIQSGRLRWYLKAGTFTQPFALNQSNDTLRHITGYGKRVYVKIP